MSNEYKLVPVVPTEAMIDAAWKRIDETRGQITARSIWNAMLAASPAHDGEVVKPYFSIEFKDYVATIIPGETDGMKNGKVDCYLQGRTLYTEPPRVVDVDLLKMLVRIRDDKTWRTNDNSLWPDLLALIRKHEAALEQK